MSLVMIDVINSIVITLLTLPGAFGQTATADARSVGTVRELPAPTGRFQIGRVTVHWTDTSRTEPVAAGCGPRQLRADIWYPADVMADAGVPAPASTPASYLDPSAFDRPESAKRLQGLLRGAYDAVREGRVRTHAREGVPFARAVRRAPVLIFSHGGGEARETYSAQLEDLASHGYVIAAISHTYESVLTMFPDGRHALLVSGRWPRPTTSAIEGLPPDQEANPDRLRWWADDIRFVLHELTRANQSRTRSSSSSSALPFAGRLDLQRIGAFGHSAGGQAAATACQIERRLRACLNQDGLSAMAPYYLDAGGWGMDQAFMLIVRNPPRDELKDEGLAAMKMTRAQVHDILARIDARQDAALRNTGRGAYRVLIEAGAGTTTHADFTDLPFLQATTETEREMRARMLGTVRLLTRAFFDKTLKGSNASLAPLLDGADGRVTTPFVERVQTFEPAKRSHPKR